MKKANAAKLQQLHNLLQSMKKVAIGFSGGTDSSFLLTTAAQTLGNKNVLAITINSVVFPKKELDAAKKFTRERNIPHLILPIDITAIKYITKNPPDRCYVCKKVIFSKVKKEAAKHHMTYVLDASNADDLQEYRPGFSALQELGIVSPLVDAHFTKAEVRELSKQMGLSTWEKPSGACLATRFPYGEEISPKKLIAIERAENYVQSLGVKQVRVRFHHDLARIEVLPKDFPRILRHAEALIDELKKQGFTYITLDLEGYRSGSLDEVLNL